MSAALKEAIDKVQKEIERDLVDHGTGLMEDAAKFIKLQIYKARGLEPKTVSTDNTRTSSPVPDPIRTTPSATSNRAATTSSQIEENKETEPVPARV